MAQPVQLSWCAGLVRTAAPDRYLATLFAPAQAREALFALYAFDHEIGKVRDVVSQPMAGLIRLQWWRDALAAIASGRPPAHPVAEALLAVLRAAPGCRARLEAALDARERELEDPPPADLNALEQELEGSSAAITQAALILLGASDPAALEVGRKVGLVVGLADRVGALDLDQRHGHLLLPIAELVRHGIDPERAAEAGERLAPVVATIAGRGLEHLRAARAERQAVPRRGLAALLPGTLAGERLRHLRRTRSVAALHLHEPLAPLRLLWRHALGRF
jgi:NADH dehydrogenase [ubiquinone] 1 alpha subcomplex assembly factor 6